MRFGRELDRDGLAIRQICFHGECHARGFPIGSRGRIKIYPELTARFVVNAVTMQRMAFHAGADATSEAAEHVLIFMLHSAPDGHHVAGAAILWIHRGENVIEKCSFEEIRVLHLRLQRKEPPRELEHVIDIAGFGCAPVNAVAQFIRRTEVFVLAMAAGGETVMMGNLLPKEFRGIAVLFVAGISVPNQRSIQFRHLGVAVQPRETILASRQRIEHGAMIESVRQIEPLFVSRVCVKIRQHLGHTAKLSIEHLLKLILTQFRQDALGPAREFGFQFQGGFVPGVTIRVPQTCVGLVKGVPRRPHAVEVKTARADFSLRDLLEDHFAVCALRIGNRPQVSVSALVLNFF